MRQPLKRSFYKGLEKLSGSEIFIHGGEPWLMNYCWPTPQYRNWCAQHAFLEGKKAWETYARKGTARTLKEVGQQYSDFLFDRPKRCGRPLIFIGVILPISDTLFDSSQAQRLQNQSVYAEVVCRLVFLAEQRQPFLQCCSSEV
jgi:hypothetical protein